MKYDEGTADAVALQGVGYNPLMSNNSRTSAVRAQGMWNTLLAPRQLMAQGMTIHENHCPTVSALLH